MLSKGFFSNNYVNFIVLQLSLLFLFLMVYSFITYLAQRSMAQRLDSEASLIATRGSIPLDSKTLKFINRNNNNPLRHHIDHVVNDF